jgi:peptide/nickel transport system substrate-binding protein
MDELRYWADQFGKGRISRREFIGRSTALGVSMALASSLLPGGAMAADPKKGGFARFAMAHGATTDTLDPGTWPDTFTQCAFYGAMCNNLTELDSEGQVVGDLAESMEAADKAKKWIFKLRKGVTFHNGKDLTAQDVVATFQYHMGPNAKSAAKSLLEAVTSVKADGPQTVVFELKDGNADFPTLVSDYHLSIFPAKDTSGIDWEKGIATGAFSLEKFEPGVSAHLKRNPNYHKDGKPYFDEVEFLRVADVSGRTNALTGGEVHFAAACDLKTLGMLKKNPDINILEVTGIGHYTFAMDTTVAPFNDANVRQALKFAIDRQSIVDKVFQGHAAAGNDNPIAPSIKYAIDPEPKHVFDVERAKFYLGKAGLKSLDLELSVADAAFNGAADAAVLYADSARKAGINITVKREANDGYWDNVWMKRPWCAVYWGGRATCDWMFSTAYAADAVWNDTKWKNPRFNELLMSARSELDDAKRGAMYGEMQQIVHDDSGTVVLVFNNYVNALSKKLAHGNVAGTWDMDGLKMAERWWFA